ncbi:hypothetical protein HanPSC8_Chr07g0299581 [Helianthus annuus]|nr:hypothetical protein HanPSC8_Chr07g0299581 [Helianthus annuus]
MFKNRRGRKWQEIFFGWNREKFRQTTGTKMAIYSSKLLYQEKVVMEIFYLKEQQGQEGSKFMTKCMHLHQRSQLTD